MSSIVENKGQLPGLGKNPRNISLSKLRKLTQSIRDYPMMLNLRELLVYPFKSKYILIGGNMRYRALKDLGYNEAPCKVIPSDTPVEDLNAFLLRDNSHFGEWDFTALDAGFDFSDIELASIDMPQVSFAPQEPPKPRAAWHAQTPPPDDVRGSVQSKDDSGEVIVSEALCDLVPRPSQYVRNEFAFCASFKRTPEGCPLSQIKSQGNVDLFAQQAVLLILSQLRFRDPSGWALVTTPFRRHKENNFADAVCAGISQKLGINYCREFAGAKNRNRIAPVFSPNYQIAESNVILYDDIFTTGSSIRAMLDIMPKKNVVVVVGINNN